ncbi:MAG: biotin--[acetyl-CoA-carboxylase] ligase [Deltaproteobacteria bacterium]|nr:MAG: biotin--[acetyl-CoA-carboxylase] ligase [Deltaproteobacteria bacterium]
MHQTKKLFHVEQSHSSKKPLLPDQIIAKLNTQWLGHTIHLFQQLQSTNLTAIRLAGQGAAEGTVVLAEYQTHGRGRRSRSWSSPPGIGIYCSIILRPKLSPAEGQLITLLTAVAVAKAVEVKVHPSPRIKWPNDILINNRKVAGILLESKAGSVEMEYAVVGVGINVNQTSDALADEYLSKATSLLIETGQQVDRSALIGQLFVELENLYETLHRGEAATILQQWRRFSSTVGQHVRVSGKEGVTEGVALDVTKAGALLIRQGDGSLVVVHAGDVEHLRVFPDEETNGE